jgi:hypothetical protein
MRTCSSVSTRPASPGALDDEADDATDLVRDRGSLLNCSRRSAHARRVGGTLHLAVDPARFHFFDAETGASLLQPGASEARPAPVAALTPSWY